MPLPAHALHPCAAALVRSDMDVLKDRDYFRRLGIAYDVQGLLAVLHNHKPKSAMPLACHSLADMGAFEALPVLRELAEFPVQDVKATAVLAVARLCGAEATDWLTECLVRKGTLKSYVLWALAAVADPRAYPAVRAWADPLIRKVERKPEAPALRNLVFAIAYLEQVAQIHPEAVGLLERFEAVARTLPPGDLSEFRSFTRMFSRNAACTDHAPTGPEIGSTGPSIGGLHDAK